MDFSETYKKLPTIKLLEILENPKDYKPGAIEAAEQELQKRHDVESAKEELKEKMAAASVKAEVREKKQRHLKDMKSQVMDAIDPRKEKAPDKLITIVCIILLCMVIYTTYMGLEILKYIFEDIQDIDLISVIYLVTYVYFPVALVLFWKRQKAGWVMLLIWSIYHCLSGAIRLYGWYRVEQLIDYSSALDIFPRPTIWYYLGPLLFYSGLLYVLCKPNVRVYFMGEKEKRETLDEQ